MMASCSRLLPERLAVNTVTMRAMGLIRMRASCRIRETFLLLSKERNGEHDIKQNEMIAWVFR